MMHRRRWLAGLAAVALALITAATAFGYAGEVAGAITVAGPGGTLKCGVNIHVTATVVDASGKRIAGQPVNWTFLSTPSTQDRIVDKSTVTLSNGVATATVVLACVPGSRRIRAAADAVFGTAVLNVTAAGLPNTSTLPTGAPRSPDSPLGTLLAVLALALGGAFVVRQLAVSRS
jgi:hypothetical protein